MDGSSDKRVVLVKPGAPETLADHGYGVAAGSVFGRGKDSSENWTYLEGMEVLGVDALAVDALRGLLSGEVVGSRGR